MTRSGHPAGHVLQAYHDGELEPGSAAAVATHCEGCAACRGELAELDSLEGRLAADSVPSPPRPMWPRVRPARGRQAGLKPAIALAACAVGVVVGVLLGPIRFGKVETVDETSWTGTLITWNSGSASSLLGVYQSELQ